MKKFYLLLFLVFVGTAVVNAQDAAEKPWKIKGINQLNFNQISFSNWQAGGDPSIGLGLVTKWYFNYKKDKISWDNNFNLQYGLFKEKGERLKKSDDLIDLNSIFGYQASGKLEYSVLFNFRTQFSEGVDSDYDSIKVSNFMAPGYLTLSPGVRYRPTDFFYILVSPITIKSTFVMDQDLADIGAFGVDPAEIDTATGMKISDGSNVNFRYGAFAEIYFGKEVVKGLSIESKLNAFYSYNKRDGLEAYDADVNWENFINYNFNDWIGMSLFVNFVYYPGQPPVAIELVDGIPVIEAGPSRQIQIKQTFGLALTYNFANFSEED
jgi:hypothetical protein